MAEINVGELVIKLKADLSELRNSVGQMEKTFGNGFASVQRQAQQAGSGISGAIGGATARLVGQIAGTLGGLQKGIQIGATTAAEESVVSIGKVSAEFTRFGAAGIQSFDSIRSASAKFDQDVRKAQNSVAGGFSNLNTQALAIAKSVAGAFGIAFSAGAVISFTRRIIDLGDRLSDLSDQTGLSIRVLGGLRVVAAQNNTSIESLATAVLLVQKNLRLAT